MDWVTGEVYSGRASGYADESVDAILARRMSGQPILNGEGFGRPDLDKISANNGSIRGREQQLIDFNGGAKSVGGTSRNLINGVSDASINRPSYMYQSNAESGPLPDNSPARLKIGPEIFPYLLQLLRGP